MKTIIFLFGLALFIAIIMPTKGGPMAVATPTAAESTADTDKLIKETGNEIKAKLKDLEDKLKEVLDIVDWISENLPRIERDINILKRLAEELGPLLGIK